MKSITQFFRAIIFDWRKKQAIRQAQQSAALHRKKFLVLVWHGQPVCVSMQGIKKLIHQKRFPDLTPQKARQIAIFEAFPPSKN